MRLALHDASFRPKAYAYTHHDAVIGNPTRLAQTTRAALTTTELARQAPWADQAQVDEEVRLMLRLICAASATHVSEARRAVRVTESHVVRMQVDCRAFRVYAKVQSVGE